MASKQKCSPSSSLSSSPHLVENSSDSHPINILDAASVVKNQFHNDSDVDTGDDSQSCPTSTRYMKDNRSPSPNDQPIIEEDESGSVLDQEELERHKKAVYDHPLFPILALLVEKCEYSTATLATSSHDQDSSSFNSQLQAFIQLQQKEGKSLVCDDPEVDTLMIKAIQVLRIHLFEMEKVQDLCKDFCQRYISCLRTKMSSENLLRGVSGFGPNGSFDGSSRSSSPSTDDESSHRPPPPVSFSSLSTSQSQTVCQAVPTSQDSFAQSPEACGHRMVASDAPKVDSGNEGDLSDDASTNGNKKSPKRGILPKQATSIMRSWLFQHIVHPYPTEEEKKTIAAQTNLTLLQVNNWFINARRRILQPMLDSANTLNTENLNGNAKSGSQSTTKKLKVIPSSSTSRTKSWPEPIPGGSGRESLD